jgi:hypothetical protein
MQYTQSLVSFPVQAALVSSVSIGLPVRQNREALPSAKLQTILTA